MTEKEASKILHNFIIIAGRKYGNHIFAQAIHKAVEALEKQDKITHCNECALRNTNTCAMHFICDCGRHISWEDDSDYCSWGIKEGDQE